MNTELTKAQKQKLFRENQAAKGLKSKQFWIPEDRLAEVEEFIASLNDEHDPAEVETVSLQQAEINRVVRQFTAKNNHLLVEMGNALAIAIDPTDVAQDAMEEETEYEAEEEHESLFEDDTPEPSEEEDDMDDMDDMI